MSKYDDYIREQNIPKSLYKFRRWTDRYDKLILTDQVIWFASPASFNDPFDCKIPFRFDLMPVDKQKERVRELARERNPDWDEKMLLQETEHVIQTHGLFSKDPKKREAAMNKYWQSIADTYGVLSFAGNYKSILMWSHYADSHCGFCVEVDAHLLATELFDLFRIDKDFVEVYPVQYEREIPIVIPINDPDEDRKLHMSLLTTKSTAWEYEQETRFIYIGKVNLARSIAKDVINRVILGCNMPRKHREKICNLVSTQLPNTEIWEAVRPWDQFKLDFSPLLRHS